MSAWELIGKFAAGYFGFGIAVVCCIYGRGMFDSYCAKRWEEKRKVK